MVKSKKMAASKKTKSEEPVALPDAQESSNDVKSDDDSEKPTQENGELDSIKKKGKGKGAKKEDTVTETNTKDEEKSEAQENGEDDGIETKKPAAAKKSKTAKKTELKPASEPARKSSRTPKPVAKENEEGAYEVQELVDFRLNCGVPQFRVRWKGYSKADDTWENEDALNCNELLQKYKADHPDVDKKGKKRAAAKSPAKSPKKSKTKEPEDYEVEEIVGMRIVKSKKEFKIRWKGYKPSDDSWEPEKHLSCQDLIEKYLADHPDELEEEEEKPAKKPRSTGKAAKGKKTRAK